MTIVAFCLARIPTFSGVSLWAALLVYRSQAERFVPTLHSILDRCWPPVFEHNGGRFLLGSQTRKD